MKEPDMEYIKIAGLPPDISRIGLGTWAIGGWMWGGTEESDAVRTIHAALDSGINLIDTAPVYGFGRSEELVGKALEGGRREGAIIATKVGLDWSSGKILRNSTPARLREELEDSLRRLKTDVIDIYQVHWPDESVPFEETARTLDAFRCEGKIRTIGVSNFSPAQMDRFRKGAPLATIQPPYNLFEREIEKDVLPYAERNGLVVLAYGALCRGLLTSKITAKTTFKGDDLRKVDPKFQQPRLGYYLVADTARYWQSGACYARLYLSPPAPSFAGARHHYGDRQRQESASAHGQEAHATCARIVGRLDRTAQAAWIPIDASVVRKTPLSILPEVLFLRPPPSKC